MLSQTSKKRVEHEAVVRIVSQKLNSLAALSED